MSAFNEITDLEITADTFELSLLDPGTNCGVFTADGCIGCPSCMPSNPFYAYADEEYPSNTENHGHSYTYPGTTDLACTAATYSGDSI